MTPHSPSIPAANYLTMIQATALKAHLIKQVELARRRLAPPVVLSNREIDGVIEDISIIRNLLKDVEELTMPSPKEGSTPENMKPLKYSEKEKMREHPGVADPAKTGQQSLTR